MGKFNLKKIQQVLSDFKYDAWLFFDFRASNELALSILDINKEKHLTRRFYYLVPKSGEPIKIVNGIEAGNLDHLPGKKLTFSSHNSLTNHLKNSLSGLKNIAMEYSPMNAIPYVSRVDAGTIEMIKSFGVNIISSADLISMLDAIWTKEQYEENIPVANALNDIVDASFEFIKETILNKKKLTEYDVQQFIMNEFNKRKYYTDFPPIVGVNENSANPHYGPTETIFKEIKENDFVLIDLWAKPDRDDAVWADITWTGFVGKTVPEKYTKIFNIVAEARDTCFNFIKERVENNKQVKGFEADNASRKVIEDAGYGEYFIHRTGHSITTDLHGSGSHLDNFETKDERLLLPSTSFSIEPGIYLTGDFGVRSEIDVYITEDKKVTRTGKKIQKEVIPILA
ncbi:MAG TPA: M24 family metallopeptidase [Ignavibacteriaceae bacterium]|nr:M24 family metallopeptidase [Ignavibacteriaceae bacterium]